MLWPVPTPVVIQVDLNCLVLLVNTVGEEILDAGILRKGNMRAVVKQETAVEPERRRVAAVVMILVVHDGVMPSVRKPVSGTEPGHSASQDSDIWQFHSSPFRFFSLHMYRGSSSDR